MAEAEEIVRVLESSLSQIKWRLKLSSKRRLETDILALCTEMRPVVMVDYGGKMPELQERLCAFLKHCRNESSAFEFLQVMVIEDMIYLIHLRAFEEFVKSSLNLEREFLFIDLEHDPPKMITRAEESPAIVELVLAQKLFSSHFSEGKINSNHLGHCSTDFTANNKPTSSQSSDFIDLSNCIKETEVTIPTLNGWLLGYPVVYLFGKDHIEDAIYNLSTKSLHLFQILVCRNGAHNDRSQSQKEELLSFSVPYELSLEGSDEPWAQAFLAHMQAGLKKCDQVWSSLRMEVVGCYPQAIAF
ncbi:PREDICTED: uncharacterized protein LOC109161605 [Ipomoea nil]|uniref:uncharacterized protein LOC109161605 n=1 Tax=Ipomoea nil TaxID=35883 RepID=UPI0009015130|nr:PREDICTED: uncharacterized protein LOC109161605 [Ipomoea nil]